MAQSECGQWALVMLNEGDEEEGARWGQQELLSVEVEVKERQLHADQVGSADRMTD
jgi:hypothetical protein